MKWCHLFEKTRVLIHIPLGSHGIHMGIHLIHMENDLGLMKRCNLSKNLVHMGFIWEYT